MSLLKQLLTFAFAVLTLPLAGQRRDTTPLENRPLDIGLVYPLSTSGAAAAHFRHGVTLSALAGLSGAVSSAAVAGIANIVRTDNEGSAIAGIVNVIGGAAAGAQIAGIANCITGQVRGAELAGILNTAGRASGAQLAGIANLSASDVHGVQIAGIFNKATTVHSQIGGLLNRATLVQGVQISGLINIADSSDYPIGFINLIADGEKRIGVQTDATLNTRAFFRSGGRVLYGVFALGANLRHPRSPYYMLETGIGAHLLRGRERFSLDGEASSLILTDFRHGHGYIYSLTLLPAVQMGDRLTFFAGPSLNLMLDYAHGRIASLVHHYPWTTTGRNGHFIGGYAGITGGIAFTL